jgi:hypothetical protein
MRIRGLRNGDEMLRVLCGLCIVMAAMLLSPLPEIHELEATAQEVSLRYAVEEDVAREIVHAFDRQSEAKKNAKSDKTGVYEREVRFWKEYPSTRIRIVHAIAKSKHVRSEIERKGIELSDPSVLALREQTLHASDEARRFYEEAEEYRALVFKTRCENFTRACFAQAEEALVFVRHYTEIIRSSVLALHANVIGLEE